MKRILLLSGIVCLIASCSNNKTETTTTGSDTTSKVSVDLPYKASYSADFTHDVSDADLKMVMNTYKDWQDGSMTNLENAMGDSVEVDFNTGDHFKGTKADLLKIWKTYRDSLSSVDIDMQSWQKMYEPTKKDAFIVTWYKETDIYKTGKVDSAYYHDINQVKNGKITWYSQYKRPAK